MRILFYALGVLATLAGILFLGVGTYFTIQGEFGSSVLIIYSSGVTCIAMGALIIFMMTTISRD